LLPTCIDMLLENFKSRIQEVDKEA